VRLCDHYAMISQPVTYLTTIGSHYREGCSLLSIITMRSRLFPANSASDCLRFVKFRPQFCEFCGAIYGPICETFSAAGSVTDIENRFQIDA